MFTNESRNENRNAFRCVDVLTRSVYLVVFCSEVWHGRRFAEKQRCTHEIFDDVIDWYFTHVVKNKDIDLVWNDVWQIDIYDKFLLIWCSSYFYCVVDWGVGCVNDIRRVSTDKVFKLISIFASWQWKFYGAIRSWLS